MEKGLIHIYCGDGKGKTTAAVGLAVRAAGAGKKVLINLDTLIEYLQNPTAEKFRVAATQKVNGVRRIS